MKPPVLGPKLISFFLSCVTLFALQIQFLCFVAFVLVSFHLSGQRTFQLTLISHVVVAVERMLTDAREQEVGFRSREKPIKQDN